MKKIFIISELYCNHIHGSFIDCIDLYYNIKNYLPCELIILVNPKYIKLLNNRFNILYTSNMAKELTTHFRTSIDSNINIDDIIICKYETIQSNIIDIHKYKNIILINDWKLTADCINNKNIIDNETNIKAVLSTNFFNVYTNKNFINYLNFSEYRLKNMRVTNKFNVFNRYNEYDELKKETNFNIHQYKGINYSRRFIEGFDRCMEIKGKLIFEFLYFNKYVHYSPLNKSFDDGLTDYLSIFNIDDNIEQDLNISKDEIYDKLVKFDENNSLFVLLDNIVKGFN